MCYRDQKVTVKKVTVKKSSGFWHFFSVCDHWSVTELFPRWCCTNLETDCKISFILIDSFPFKSMVTVDKFMLCPFNFWVVGCTQTISTAVKMNISKLCLHVLYASDMALENGFLSKTIHAWTTEFYQLKVFW